MRRRQWLPPIPITPLTSSWRAASPYVGYSAGGLFNRYACGLLWREGFFLRVRPVCFITIATPHLGCRELPHSSAQRLRNGFMATVSNFYCGRSGQQVGPRSPNLLLLVIDCVPCLQASPNKVLLHEPTF